MCAPVIAAPRRVEYRDAAFLKRLKLDDHVEALAKFWPERGRPHWDSAAAPRDTRRWLLRAHATLDYSPPPVRGSLSDDDAPGRLDRGIPELGETLGRPGILRVEAPDGLRGAEP